MLNGNFVILGTIIFFFGSFGYVIETIQGKVKPNRVTWFLWGLSPLIAFAAQIQQGVGIQALLTFIIGFIGVAVFISSFLNKKAYWKIGKLDIVCGILSLLGLFLWFITKVGNIAIAFSILSDLLAAIPTIIKSYKEPETENYLLYFTNSISGLITLLTIKNWNFETFGFTLYVTICSGLIAALVKFKIGKIIDKA